MEYDPLTVGAYIPY